MKKMKWLLAILMIAMTLAACTTQTVTEIPAQEEIDTVPTEATEEPVEATATEAEEPVEETEVVKEPIDYFEDKAIIEYAQGFTVEYFDNYKIVEVLTPWDFSEETFKYVLVQRGTEAPEGIENVDAVVEIPIETIIPLSTTFIPFIEINHQMDTIVAVSDGTYISNETVLKKFADGELPAVGYGATVDVETILNLEPDIIMANGYGFPDYDTHPVLIDAGLTTIINGDYMESTPLGRAEWGKFIALFYNTEKTANEFFSQTVENYNEIVALAADVENKPTVFFNTAWEGTWYMPGGNSYLSLMVQDAGGDYLWKDDPSTSSLYLSFEEVIEVAGENAEIWLHPGGFSFSIADVLLSDERYGEFNALQNGMLYNNNAKLSAMGGNDYFESGVAYPDVILADLFSIFHPDLMPDHELQYYMKLD